MSITNFNAASLNINTLKTSIKSIDNLSSVELFKLESYIDMANFYGEDDNTIEEGQEKEKLITLIRTNFKGKADEILEKLGLSSTAQSGNSNQKVEEKSNLQNTPTPPVKSSSQKFIEETLKDPMFSSDKIFQKYAKFINALDNQMQTIENQYGFKRDSVSGPLTILDKNKKDYDKYVEYSSKFNLYSPMLKSYVNEMKNWKDGSLGTQSFENRNGIKFTNLERITLKDGARAWKSNEGVFYPYMDGRIGGYPVEDKSLIP